MAGFQVTFKVLAFVAYSVVVALAIQVAWWAMDREPPFKVLTSQVIPPVYPGGKLVVEGEVKRDLTRECSFTAENWIEDRSGTRHFLPDLGMTVEAIKRAEQVTPGRTRYAVTVPPDVPLGPSVYAVIQSYTCNPIHLRGYPIQVETRIPFMLEARP